MITLFTQQSYYYPTFDPVVKVCEAIKSGVITKPIVAWCIGTCADMFTTDVQFGHAGASAGAAAETATSKNAALGEAGAHVPASFDELGDVIRAVYSDLVSRGVVVPKPEVPPPPVPMDYNWARETMLIFRPRVGCSLNFIKKKADSFVNRPLEKEVKQTTESKA